MGGGGGVQSKEWNEIKKKGGQWKERALVQEGWEIL